MTRAAWQSGMFASRECSLSRAQLQLAPCGAVSVVVNKLEDLR